MFCLGLGKDPLGRCTREGGRSLGRLVEEDLHAVV